MRGGSRWAVCDALHTAGNGGQTSESTGEPRTQENRSTDLFAPPNTQNWLVLTLFCPVTRKTPLQLEAGLS